MAVYSLAQLQALLRQVGFPENEIAKMAAIGKLESGGRTDVINPGIWYEGKFSNEYSVGIWQINTKVHKKYSVQQLKDPLINAQEALRVYKMQGYNAWFNSNKKYNSNYQGVAADSRKIYNAGGSNVTSIVSSNPVVISDISQINFLPTETTESNSTALYIALGILGIVILTR